MITFLSLRRSYLLFDRFEGCKSDGFIKQLGEGKEQAKLIVSEDKKGVMTLNEKAAECLQVKLTTMAIGIRLELASDKYRKSLAYFDSNY